MIHYVKGNLLESQAQALVNTVNTVGVMGKGIASQLLRGYYSNYSLELLSSVDYLLQTVPALSSWQTDDRNQVLDTLMQEVQHWSRRKEQMFPRNLLAQAVDYLQQQQALFS